ncbi:uncharacterized protein LOC131443153 isoform X3 [Solea solea]|uniref:uncharacterized protein LOC131443153 isoform X3 n=1 Tax=Solea solea TaxID=90069 RepID=UPI002729CC19|nr:uncharacterized protein LOC131443153 isoform X3 [Solea solea]
MSEIRWIKTLLFLTLELHFTETIEPLILIIKEGDEATLTCGNMKLTRDKCGWIHTHPGKAISELVENGKLRADQSHRLSVTEHCSLVIKKVTTADRGRYDCQRIAPLSDALVYLSAVKLTEQKDEDKVTLSCSVPGHELNPTVNCRPVNGTNSRGSQMECSTTFSTSYLKRNPNYRESFICEVTDGYRGDVQTFTFSSSSSVEYPPTPTAESISSSNPNVPMSGQTPQTSLWWYIGVAVGGASLLLAVVAAVRWKRNEGKTQTNGNAQGQRLNPTETQSSPDTSHDMADPEEGVSYASVSYIKRSNGKAGVQVKAAADDDEEEEGAAVTYSTVNVRR